MWPPDVTVSASKSTNVMFDLSRVLKDMMALAWGIHTQETPSASHSLLFATAAGSSCINTPERLRRSAEGAEGGVRGDRATWHRSPQVNEGWAYAWRMLSCWSESGKGKKGENRKTGREKKKCFKRSYARKSKQVVTEQISVVSDVRTYGKVKGQWCARRWRAARWRVNAKVKFWLSDPLS